MNTARQGAGPEKAAIAIIGMDCLFPNARNLQEYWRSIRRGADGITEVPPTHWAIDDYVDADPKAPDMTYCGRGGFLSPVAFDPTEFGIPPTILEATDTAQLLSLFVAKRALEDAGCGEDADFNRERVSVILGITGTQELVLPLSARLGHPLWRKALKEAGVAPDVAERVVRSIADGYVPWQENSFPGLLGNVVAGRIANRLNLRGTNCVVDAACASSLGAVHLAMLELNHRHTDMVLTGGSDALNDIFMYMCFSKTPALSPTGDARPFSDDADGTVLGEGVGMLVLKRLADARRDGDRIYAVIQGIGTSSDGRSQSIYAPHPAGQAAALRDAYQMAAFGPGTVGLVEAHGTGTTVGDAAEVEALKTVFREARSDGTWCALGSVKSQIGHTKAAAGAAGLIKAALAIHHRTYPPTIKVRRPNAKLDLGPSPFYLNTELRPWVSGDGRPRRAGVSSFGFGGSNFHAVLEEHQETLPEVAWDASADIIALSAGSVESLTERLDDWLADEIDLCNREAVAYKAAVSRREFSAADAHRLVLVVEADADLDGLLNEARAQLSAPSVATAADGSWQLPNAFYGCGRPEGDVAFLFPGQGSQYVGMASEMACSFPEVLAALSDADAAADRGMDDQGAPLSQFVYPHPVFTDEARDQQAAALARTNVAQPAIGAVCLGMARVLERFGLTADMLAGHSYGELVALCLGGRFDADTLHALSRLRGRLMADGSGDRGTMLAVQAPLDELARLIEQEGLDVVVANRNAPRQGVLSGDREAIGRAAQACRSHGLATMPLSVSGAFHSRLMEGAVGPFRQALEAVALQAGTIPVFANTTGGPYPADPASARDLLARQMIEPVDFVREVENLYHAGARTFIEVGPKAVLTRLVDAILADRPHRAVGLDPAPGRSSAIADLARVLAQCAALGRPVNLTAWERPALEPRKAKMVVPLVGANLRTGNAGTRSRVGATPHRHDEAGSEHAHPRPTALCEEGNRDVPDNHHDTGPPESRLPADGEQARCQAPPSSADQGAALPALQPPHETSPQVEDSNAYLPAQNAEGATIRAQEPWLANSLRLVEEGLVAMQDLHRRTAEAHQRFLEVQEQSHKVLANLIAAHQQAVGPSASGLLIAPPIQETAASRPVQPDVVNEAPLARPRPAAPIAPPPPRQPTPEETVAATPVIEPTDAAPLVEPVQKNETATAALNSAAPVGDSNPDAPPPSQPPATGQMASAVLEVVAEKTGYPREMLDLDMDIEGDLGIDSIKRVEIMAAVEERLPEAPKASPEFMGGLRTLREIVSFLESEATPPAGDGNSPDATGIEAGAGTPHGSVTEAPCPQPADSPAEVLLAVVAELTGYPAEMLDLDMDLEADLGIDSIKRVEILAAVEARRPDLPPVKPEIMGSLRTLRQIVAYCGGEAPSAGPSSESIAPPVVASPDQTAPVPPSADDVAPRAGPARQVLRSCTLPPPSDGDLCVAPGCEVWVTDDGAALARAVVAELAARGQPARLVDPVSDIGGEHPDLPRAAGQDGARPIGGLVIVAPPVDGIGMTWNDRSEAFLKGAFALTKALSAGLRSAAARGGALLATVSRMDGAFGLIGGAFDATQGGLAGLVKTAAREWPEVRCRVLDVATTWQDADLAAAAVVGELASDTPIEVGLDGASRRGLTTVPEPCQIRSAGFGKGDVVVVTGGARGITAECVVALARQSPATFVLLGRSPAPAEEPPWLSGLELEADVRKAILEHGISDRPTAKPADVQAACDRFMAGREIRRTLERIADAGARGLYRQLDVCDESAVRSVLGEVGTTLGPIRGVIHAAGVLADRKIDDKTPEQFEAVFDTKVRGLRHVLGAVPLESLRHLVLFSSVSARLGNVGQVDYAMANEVLNKAAHRLAAELPACRVVALNWGPWDGGMVRPALRRMFTRRGVSLISLDAGAAFLADELRNSNDGAVEVIVGSGLKQDGDTGPRECARASLAAPACCDPASAPTTAPRQAPVVPADPDDALSLAFERTLDVVGHGFLRSHLLNDHPVLPLAMMMEWLGHAAVHRNPGLMLHGFDGLRVLSGLVLRDGPVPMHVFAAKPKRNGSFLDVQVELRSGAPGDSQQVHARASAVLAPALPPPPASEPPTSLVERPYDRGVDRAYAEVLFHGEHFHGIEEVIGISQRGMVARLRAAPAPAEWMADALRSDWLADPLVVDAGFQMAILWCFEEMGVVCLPAHLGRYRQFRRCFPAGGVTASLAVRKRTEHLVSVDITYKDQDDVVVARIEGCECTAGASLWPAFRRGHGSVAGVTQ